MLTEEGLDRYVDAHTLQQEIAEANDMTADDLDKAARMLLHPPDENHTSTTHPGQRSPYYEHLGGFLVQEMKDYNCYSTKDDLNHKGYSQSSSEPSDDEMVFVTSLWSFCTYMEFFLWCCFLRFIVMLQVSKSWSSHNTRAVID